MTRAGILVLSLILALGSVYQAVMHLAHGSGTLVELCIDGQAETIVIGPDGDPRPATGHDCTECLLIAGFDRPSHGLASPHEPVPRALAFWPGTRPVQPGASLAAFHARAPPAGL